MTRGWIVVVAFVTGCGRLGFEAREAPDSGQGTPGDDGSAQIVALPGCQGLAATCGPGEDAPCCESSVITGGTFYRGYDGLDFSDMTYPATLSTFRLDKYEVTVGRFRQFLAAGMGTQQNPPAAGAGARMLNGLPNQAGWDPSWTSLDLAADTTSLVGALATCGSTWTDTPGANENLPISCVTWYEAMAFCVWDGGYLPTEAEWNYAASGGSEQRAYPWSNPASSLTLDCTRANVASCNNGGPTSVGSASPTGDGRWGQSDLAGNVFEWTYDGDLFTTTFPNPCDDCVSLTGELAYRRMHGGSYANDTFTVRAAARSRDYPIHRTPLIGIRCARAP